MGRSGKKTIFKYIQIETPPIEKDALWLDTKWNIVRKAYEVGDHLFWGIYNQIYGYGSDFGYICGGYDGTNYFSTIDRFTFPFDSGTATHVGNLSGSRRLLSANNSSIHGYICGGHNSIAYISTIDRFTFPFDSGTATHVGNLSGSRGYLEATDGTDFVTQLI